MVVVVVVVVGRVPGVGARLVEVAVQGGGGVRVSGERKLRVRSRQSAAQCGGDGRLMGAVPEGRRETSLAHWEWSIYEDGRPHGERYEGSTFTEAEASVDLLFFMKSTDNI